jgi:class 3 adenylate cyclase
MALLGDLKREVEQIFKAQWNTRKGNTVPESDNLRLSNDAVEIDGTILYADLTASTNLVDTKNPLFAAEVYKTYLHCAAKIIRSEGGAITAYDGDRIMAVFIGETKNTSAARTALKINYAVKNIINPALKVQYPDSDYVVRQTIGVDTSKLTVARTGIRGSNDLVWVGRAANYAAKLCALPPEYSSRITGTVYDAMLTSAKTSSDGRSMWERVTWNPMNKMAIYRSNWTWTI